LFTVVVNGASSPDPVADASGRFMSTTKSVSASAIDGVAICISVGVMGRNAATKSTVCEQTTQQQSIKKKSDQIYFFEASMTAGQRGGR